MIKYAFHHSFGIVVIFVLAFWIPIWFLPSNYGFNSVNEGYIEADLNQYNTITFITYPINLDKMSSVRKYNITFSSILSLTKYTNLIIFEESSRLEYHEILLNSLNNRFGEKRVSFISSDLQFEQDSELLLSDFSSRAISQVRTKFVCYINANVVVDSFWYDRIMNLFNAIFENEPNSHIYLTGRRIQVPLTNNEIKEFVNLPSLSSANFFKSLRKLIKSKKDVVKCIKQCESDYFIATVDPAPFDLRYLPGFIASGGFYSMYLNYVAETKENYIVLNEEVPVYYIGSLPNINDKNYIMCSQYNYDLIHNNSYHITKNIDMPNVFNGKSFVYKWNQIQIKDSSYSTLLNKHIKCANESDMPNVTLKEFSTINHHYFSIYDEQNEEGNIDGVKFHSIENKYENDEDLDQDKKKENDDNSDQAKKEKLDGEDNSDQDKKEKLDGEDDSDQDKKKKHENDSNQGKMKYEDDLN